MNMNERRAIGTAQKNTRGLNYAAQLRHFSDEQEQCEDLMMGETFFLRERMECFILKIFGEQIKIRGVLIYGS